MNLSDLVTFRQDLLFHGAVQVGWFETDQTRCKKAAEHFVFHGPNYHGVRELDFGAASAYRLKDTASFTRDIIQQLAEAGSRDNPFALAVAGYGTGKSHLGLTLAALLANPQGTTAQKVIANLRAEDRAIGNHVESLLQSLGAPRLVVAINGMKDFDLVGEITRQVLNRLNQIGESTAPLEDLRPRFRTAQNFVRSFSDSLKHEFVARFGSACTHEQILELLACQDEAAFRSVSDIYEQRMGEPIRAVGQESLQNFVSVVRQKYCGPDKPFSGLMIIFDEFGRYLEFAVQKPHIAGTGGLQQLFEAVQDNSESSFLLCLIQNELRAYASRVAPELRDSLERYVSRYDSAPKVRLSTNLETIIASLLQKQDLERINRFVELGARQENPTLLMGKLREWFPDMQNHALWNDVERFTQVIQKGCWPLHPASTWLLYHLSSVGKSLQQRSAMSFLDDAFTSYAGKSIDSQFWSIRPVDLCSDYMVAEFLTSEQYGQQGAVAHAYESALQRYKQELDSAQKAQLKAVLLAAKMGLRVASEAEYLEALALLTGLSSAETVSAVKKLSREFGLLEWNDVTHQFDIVGDAVPRRAFVAYLTEQIRQIGSEQRAGLFAQHIKKWFELNKFETDFGSTKEITTTEWHYSVTCSNVFLIESHIEYALRAWTDALAVDTCRGQAIYCYVGPESDLEKVRNSVQKAIERGMQEIGVSMESGAPVAVILLHDENGLLAERLAEYWLLTEQSGSGGFQKFTNFIADRKIIAKDELQNSFKQLEKQKDLVLACKMEIPGARLQAIFSNLFDALYPNLVPFPFDGFYTARGNAASDCRQFTTELFSGSLNQSWIAARSARPRNRAVTVLQESWKILARDGTVSTKPGNRKVAGIIELFDSMLKSGRRLNLGKAVRLICLPPFGCNIASAGLLLGVFVSPRKDRLRIIRNSRQISVENWLSDAFQRDYLDMAVLAETEFEHISPEESDEWQALLDDWDLEPTHEGQVEYLKKAVILQREIDVPPGLYYRWELLAKNAKSAHEKLEQWRSMLLENEGHLDNAYQKGHAGNLARCGADLVKLVQKMKVSQDTWTREQHIVVQEAFERARQAAKQFFPTWLQREVVTDPLQFERFKHRMRLTGENLVAIGLESEAHQAEEHLRKVTTEVDRLIRINTVVNEVKVFKTCNQIAASTKVNEINNCLERIQALETTLRDAATIGMPVPQLENATESLRGLKRRCQEQLKAHKDRAGAIWNTELRSLQDVRETAQEVRTLMTLYDGREEDLQDFRLMIKLLTKFEEHYLQMNLMTISKSELESRLQNALTEIQGLLTEDDEIPWEIDITYGHFLIDIEEKRRDYANKWMAANVPAVRKIDSLDAAEAHRIRGILFSPPPVLGEEQQLQVQASRKACSRRLDDLKVEGLLVRFKDLSKDAQIDFLQRAQQILGDSPILARFK